MVKFIYLKKSSHRFFLTKSSHSFFLTYFQSIFYSIFSLSYCKCLTLFEIVYALFFKYCFLNNRVVKIIYLTKSSQQFFNICLVNFQTIINPCLVNFLANYLVQMFSLILNCVCFVFKVFFFKQHSGKVYSFNKVFTPVFLVTFQSIISQFYIQFFNQIFSELVVNFIHLIKPSHQFLQSIFSQLLVNFQSIF